MYSTKAVLIIGGSGFIGTHLAQRLRDSYKVFATYYTRTTAIRGVTLIPCDVTNRNWVKRLVYTARPDVIVYLAGDPSLELAEKNQRAAEQVHTGGPATVSAAADILQPKFIYLSNCFAFDGIRGNYHESDIVLPGTAMGKAKVGGENFIRGKSLNHIIVRSSPVFGRGNGKRHSALDLLRMKLDRGERVELPSYELHSFAPVSGLVDLIARLVDSGPRNKTLHYGGLTKASHFELARAFAARFGYDPELVQPKQLRAEDAKFLPDSHLADYSLNSTVVAETLKIKPLLLEEGFDLLEKELVPRF